MFSPSKSPVLRRMFCGLMSRCAMFRLCRYSKAFSTSRMHVRVFCSVNKLSSSKIACSSPPAALKRNFSFQFPSISEANVSCSHLQNENELAAGFVHSVKPHNLLGIGAQHQHGDFMLNLLDPTGGPTSTSQKLRCILDARLFVCCSTNRSEVSPARREKELKHNELVRGGRLRSNKKAFKIFYRATNISQQARQTA